mgnify:CR=1 FL=1
MDDADIIIDDLTTFMNIDNEDIIVGELITFINTDNGDIILNELTTFVNNVTCKEDAYNRHRNDVDSILSLCFNSIKEIMLDDYDSMMEIIIGYLYPLNDHSKCKSNCDNIDKFLHTLVNKHKFLPPHFPLNVKFIMETVSPEKEIKLFKYKTPDWKLILPENLITARNIVSDAEKLSYFGKNGCVNYVNYLKEIYPNDDYDAYEKKYIIFYEEKLNIYLKYLFSYDFSRDIAKSKHNEVKTVYNKLINKHWVTFLHDRLKVRPNIHVYIKNNENDDEMFGTCQLIQDKIFIFTYNDTEVICEELSDFMKKDMYICATYKHIE